MFNCTTSCGSQFTATCCWYLLPLGYGEVFYPGFVLASWACLSPFREKQNSLSISTSALKAPEKSWVYREGPLPASASGYLVRASGKQVENSLKSPRERKKPEVMAWGRQCRKDWWGQGRSWEDNLSFFLGERGKLSFPMRSQAWAVAGQTGKGCSRYS